MAKVVIVADGNEVHAESENSLPTVAKIALSLLREIKGANSPLSAGFGLVTELDPERGDADAVARR